MSWDEVLDTVEPLPLERLTHRDGPANTRDEPETSGANFASRENADLRASWPPSSPARYSAALSEHSTVSLGNMDLSLS